MGVNLGALTWQPFRAATPGARHAQRAWPMRVGLRVLLEDSDGRIGQGEASPLPGYSPDDIREAERSLAQVELHQLSLEPEHIVDALRHVRSPSARFALETALLDLAAQERGLSYARLLCAILEAPACAHSCAGTALVSADQPVAVATALRAAAQQGFRSFKLKVGARGAFAMDQARLFAAKEALPAGGRLRADANRAYDGSELAAKMAALAPLELEWLEEPAPATALGDLGPLPCAAALDESLADANHRGAAWALLDAGRVRVVVLKPAVLGGVIEAHRFAARARRAGASAVASHLFDGPIAYAACVAFACVLDAQEPGSAHGLGPHAGLEPWTGAPELFRAGALHAPDGPGLGLPKLGLPTTAGEA